MAESGGHGYFMQRLLSQAPAMGFPALLNAAYRRLSAKRLDLYKPGFSGAIKDILPFILSTYYQGGAYEDNCAGQSKGWLR